MKKFLLVCLVLCMGTSLIGCGKETVSLEVFQAAEEAWNTQLQQLQQEVEALKQQAEALQKTMDTFHADFPADDYTQYYNYTLIDGKYCAASIKQDVAIPEVLVVPNRYNGIEVAYTGNELIGGLPVKTIIFESGVECSAFLCGYGNNCPTLENIVFLSEDPKDAIYRKINDDNVMPLQLNNPQRAGSCKIYVPDASVKAYITAWSSFPEYEALIRPLSEISEDLLPYIN